MRFLRRWENALVIQHILCWQGYKLPFIYKVEEVKKVLEKRIIKILSFAKEQNYKVLVLGAWGCGVFKNDPYLVATLFKKHLTKTFEGVFEYVYFLVYDNTDKQELFKIFEKIILD